MSESYYAAGQSRARKVHELFTRIARRYDLINDIQSFGLHRRWKSELVRMSRVNPGDRMLDVCAGTGDVALRFSNAGARSVGCDFTAAMLDLARERDQDQALGWVRGDALALPFNSGTFDVVSISYGLRNLADFEKGVSELFRVTKPGGRILVLDFGIPENGIWRMAYFAYLSLAVPIFGLIFCGDAKAYAYILESLRHYPAQKGVDSLFERFNCKNRRIHNFLGGAMSINYAERS